MSSEFKEGKVKWWKDELGYGFILDANGKEYFVHHTSIVASGYRSLNTGEIVTFVPKDDDNKPKALNVSVIKPAE